MNRIPTRVLVLIVTTVTLASLALGQSWSGPGAKIPWFWLAVCLAAELLWVKLPLGKSCVTMASAAHFAALLVLPRGEAMLATAVSGLVAELLVLRKPPVRAVFNSGQATLAVGAASLTLTALGFVGPNVAHPDNLPALAAGALVYFIVNTGFVSLAIALDQRLAPVAAWRTNFGTREELLSNGALFSLGAMVAGLHHVTGFSALVLATMPLLVVWQAYRHAMDARRPRIEEDLKQAA